jgi:hypothetical protein
MSLCGAFSETGQESNRATVDAPTVARKRLIRKLCRDDFKSVNAE